MSRPPPPTIGLLGPVTVTRGGVPVGLPQSQKTRALLAYLAVTGRPQQRERLCAMFWDVADDPRGALRWSLSKLRVLDDEDAPRIIADRQTAGFEPAGRQALVLGAGGGARAVVYGLARAGCQVTIYNRSVARGEALAREMGMPGQRVVAAASLAELDLEAFDLLVNATSLGMAPHVTESPWPENLPLRAHWTVFDLVYNPPETRLLARARAAGARVLGGLPMLVHQGALAFQLWTGECPPVEVMERAAREALTAMRGTAAVEDTAEAVITNGKAQE